MKALVLVSSVFVSLLLPTMLALNPVPAEAGLTPAARALGVAPDLFTGAERALISKESPRGSVIVFLSAKCPCSRSHERVLGELAQTFSPQGFHFTGVLSNADEEETTARQHFETAKLPFPILRDPKAEIADRLGANRTPHAFVLSSAGEILFQGGVDDAKDAGKAQRHYLRDALERISQGKLPEVREARSLGCKITRP